MYFPESEAIATDFPTLASAIDQLDYLIYQTGAVPIRLAVAADFLGVQTSLAERLLSQFIERGALRSDRAAYCRKCDIFLEADGDQFFCDICERSFEKSDVHHEKVFFVVDPIIRTDVEPADDATSIISPTIIQFIAGDRGGTQQAQVQAPREHKQIAESLERSRYRSHFTLVAPVFAATISDIALVHTGNPTILHFAGHGDDRTLSVIRDHGALVQSQPLAAAQLRQILAHFPVRVHCCLLNTCDSIALAQGLVPERAADIAIGWHGRVPDNTAIDFASMFYRHLGEGLSFGQAFGLAQACCPSGSPVVELCHAAGINPAASFAVRPERIP